MRIFSSNDEHWPAPNLTPEEWEEAHRQSEEYLKTVKEAFTDVDGNHLINMTKLNPSLLFGKILDIGR